MAKACPCPPIRLRERLGSISSPPCRTLEIVLEPGGRYLVPTGIALDIPQDHEAQVGRGPGSRAITASPCSTRRERSIPIIAAKSACC